MIPSINILLAQTWSRVGNNSVSGPDQERERDCQWASEQDRPGRATRANLSLSPARAARPAPASDWLGQSYFVSNRLDTQSELQSVLTKYQPEKIWICLINQPPRDCPETVSCWQWRHWHCDLLIGKFALIRILFSSQLRTVTVREIRNLICSWFKWQKLRPLRTNLAIIFRHLDNQHQIKWPATTRSRMKTNRRTQNRTTCNRLRTSRFRWVSKERDGDETQQSWLTFTFFTTLLEKGIAKQWFVLNLNSILCCVIT